jgi:hypothetical protein
MTGEKNRGTSLEKLWKLDDETLTTPEHDRLVMLFFDDDFKRKFVSFIERGSTDVEITGVSVKDLEYRRVSREGGGFQPAFIPNESNYSIIDTTHYKHGRKHCPYTSAIIDIICPPIEKKILCKGGFDPSKPENAALVKEHYALEELRTQNDRERQRLWEVYFACHYTNWKLKREDALIQKRIDNIPVIKQELIDAIKTTDVLDWYTIDIQSEVPIVTGGNKFIVGYWDIIITITPKHRIKNHIEYKRAADSKRLFIEVKPVIDSFGKVLRQLNTYREHQGLNKQCGSQYIMLFTEDTTFQSAFENQGIPVIHPSDILS